MSPAKIEETKHLQRDAGFMAALGGWLFRHRTTTPVPFFLALILVRWRESAASLGLIAAGVALVVGGEAVRLWGVHHIGAISRTRSDRLGPLVDGGPFAYVRNPLYLGNIALWVGFALIARLVWMAPLIAVLLGLEYHAIVRWEEGLLASRLGAPYRGYMTRVPRWIPTLRPERVIHARRHRGHGDSDVPAIRSAPSVSSVSSVSSVFESSSGAPIFSWRDTFFSERGTLIAIVAGCVLLWIKARF